MHHCFQGDRSYPKRLPQPCVDWTKEKEVLASYCARLISLIDFYDAATHRKNEKFTKDGISRIKTNEEVQNLLLKHNTDQRYLISELYQQRIFT